MIFIATDSGTPARFRFRTAVRRKSCGTRPGQPAAAAPYLSREVGVARYEHIVDFDFSAGDAYWQRSGAFWRDVRAAWDAVYADRESFEYLEEVNGQEMFVPLFDYAERLNGGEPYDATVAAEIIRATFAQHLR